MPLQTSHTQDITVAGQTSFRLSNGLSATVEPQFADRIGASTSEWRSFFDQLVADAAALPGYSQLKYSQSGEIIRVQPIVAGTKLDLVCRNVVLGSSFQYLRSKMVGGIGSVLAKRARYLLQSGVHTAGPVAGILPSGDYRNEWVICEYVENLVDLDRVALQLLATVDARRTLQTKTTIMKKVVEMFVGLERNRLAHRDLKASNILLRDWNGNSNEVSIWILDLEGLKKKTYLSPSRRLQPLMRLAASVLGYSAITRSDFCRFCKHYLHQRGRSRREWKPFFWRLQKMAETYVRKSRQRKTHKLDGYLGDD